MNSPIQRSHSISYAKGCAIIGVILIHLIDWCEIHWSENFLLFKELLYPFVLIFLATAGSLMVIASQKYDLSVASKRFVKRGAEILAIYFLYSSIKLLIFDFDTQPFFDQFRNNGTLTFTHIFTFKAYDVPITILLTIAFFVMFSPIILLLIRRAGRPKTVLSVLVLTLFFINYILPHSTNAFVDFIYAKGNVTFPIMLWLVPFLLGMLMALYNFEKWKYALLFFWGVMTIFSLVWWRHSGRSEWLPSAGMYPLHPYYISFSFFFMYLVMILFDQLEKLKNKKFRQLLAAIQIFGDNTLELYILHWLLIDLTSWLLYPNMFWIWVIIPIFLVSFALWHRSKIEKISTA